MAVFSHLKASEDELTLLACTLVCRDWDGLIRKCRLSGYLCSATIQSKDRNEGEARLAAFVGLLVTYERLKYCITNLAIKETVVDFVVVAHVLQRLPNLRNLHLEDVQFSGFLVTPSLSQRRTLDKLTIAAGCPGPCGWPATPGMLDVLRCYTKVRTFRYVAPFRGWTAYKPWCNLYDDGTCIEEVELACPSAPFTCGLDSPSAVSDIISWPSDCEPGECEDFEQGVLSGEYRAYHSHYLWILFAEHEL